MTRNISLLRQALGGEGQRLIVTAARAGYRYAGSVLYTEDGVERTQGEQARVPAVTSHGERGQRVVGREAELALLRRAFAGSF